ncbi:MAG: hypothetical protein QF441_01020 [Bacteriovoracaceae bacterium]|nr:hypothetical protein [Halobacteriovoraceae bacterium]MDP7319151.1 hypothetical protein [Bacteriovoracaceae bacterium]
MKKLLIMALVLSSTNSFSFSQEFEFKNVKDKTLKVSLKLMAGRICHNLSSNKFTMYSYFGGNRDMAFYNSCAVVEYELSCLGEIASTYIVYDKKFCINPMKFKAKQVKLLHKSFTDKYACKKIFDNIVREKKNSIFKCLFDRGSEKIDEIVDFENENKKGIADEK